MQYRKHNPVVNLTNAAAFDTEEGFGILFGEINEITLDENFKKRLVVDLKAAGLNPAETLSDLQFSQYVLESVYASQPAQLAVANQILILRENPFNGSKVGEFDTTNGTLAQAIGTLVKNNTYDIKTAKQLIADDLASKKANRNIPTSFKDRISTIGPKQIIITAAAIGLLSFGLYKFFK